MSRVKQVHRGCKAKLAQVLFATWRYFQQFSEITTLHGLRYVTEPNRHPLERIFWLTGMTICTLWCGLHMQLLWKRWQSSPVIVTLAESSTKIWDIPFPAITICPENRLKKSRFDIEREIALWEAGERLKNNSREDILNIETALMVCKKLNTSLFEGSVSLNESHLHNLEKLSFSIDDVLSGCEWGQLESKGCRSLFRNIVTDEGMCFTFNLLQNSDILTDRVKVMDWTKETSWVPLNSTWDPERGYEGKELIEMSYPARAVSNGHESGLRLRLRVHTQEIQPCCTDDVYGFKLMVHSVSEFPQVSSQFFRMPLDSMVSVAVRPDMLTTSQSLRNHKPKLRGCYFPHERNLTYFKVYTQQNCDLECFITAIRIQCRCQLFYLPSQDNMTFCYSSYHVACIKDVRGVLHNVLAYVTKKKGSDPFCKCLPGCWEHKYNLEISNSQLHLSPPYDSDVYRYIDLAVYFKDMQFIHSHRSELYSTLDFLANCGGLLGLFTGFSITSGIEICYFLSLRLWCNLRGHQHRQRVRDPQISFNSD